MSVKDILTGLGKALLVLAVTAFLIWITIVSALEYNEYVWIYSDDNKIEAMQHMAAFAWGLSIAVSPAWILAIVIILLRILKVNLMLNIKWKI